MTLSAVCLFWTQRQIDQVISEFRDLSGRGILSSELSSHIWGYFEVSLFVLEGAHCSASEFVCPWCIWTCLCSLGQACWGMCPPNPLLLPHLMRLAMALISPWPTYSWGRLGAKTSVFLSTELQEIASNSQSSHFPWDKLLCVVWLYIWLHCNWPCGCHLCQWSIFLSFTILSILRFASFINNICRFS